MPNHLTFPLLCFPKIHMKFKCSVDCINEYILGSISFFLKNIYLFIYLAALGLSDNLWDLFDCGTRDLVP